VVGLRERDQPLADVNVVVLLFRAHVDRLGLTPRESEVLRAAAAIEDEAERSLASCSSACTRSASG
jgi:hypothetical protein